MKTALTAHPRWIYSPNRRRRYLWAGEGLELAGNLQFLSGIRGLTENLWLHLAPALNAGIPVEEGPMLRAWQLIESSLDKPSSSAFLLDTSRHKKTTLVGPVRSSEVRFVKLYSASNQAEAEVGRAQLVENLALGLFRTAGIVDIRGNLVSYELLPRGRRLRSLGSILAAVKEMCERGLKSAGVDPTLKRIDLERLGTRMNKIGYEGSTIIENSGIIDIALSSPSCACHGDCTPWNTFVDGTGKPCLIDYEEAGFSPPFFDYFHWWVQPAVLRSKLSLDVRSFMNPLQREHPDAWMWYLAYLTLALESDLKKVFIEQSEDPRLERVVKAHGWLLRNALESLNR